MSNKTNSKIVRDLMIKHVLEQTGDDKDLLLANNEAVKMLGMSDYQAGLEQCGGGNFLIYYGDQREFLKTLDLNGSDREYSDAEVWNLYTHLCAKAVEELAKGSK